MSTDNNTCVIGRFDSPFYVVAFSLFGWVVAGYAFFTLIVFHGPIGNYFFLTDNPADTQYVIFGIIALSLLARFVGGMVFGRIGDKHGRLFVIKIVLTSITIIEFVSFFLYWETPIIEFVPIFFIITRILIGFFTGGLWPTGGVYALEKLQHYYHEKSKKDEKFFEKSMKRKVWKVEGFQIKKLGWQSSWVQSGFQWSILLEVLLSYGLLYTDWNFETQWILITSIGIGLGVTGVLFCLIMKESCQWSKKIDKQSESIQNYRLDVRKDAQKETSRKTIVNLWLVMAGVMYLFYATMGLIGGYFPRSDHIVSFCNEVDFCNWIYGAIMFTVISLVAHIMPGHHITRIWKKQSFDKEISFSKKIQLFVTNPYFAYGVLLKLDAKILLQKLVSNIHDSRFKEKASENQDIVVILTHGYLALYATLFVLILFFVLYLFSGNANLNSLSNYVPTLTIHAFTWFFTAFILFVVTSTWSIIPSTLSSMFPIARRNFWTSTIYTGGTIVGFAAPFVSIQIIQQFDHVWLLIPLILGSISIIIGSRSIITNNRVRSEYSFRPGDKMDY